MLRLELAGPDTLLASPLCARCPQGSTGCCAGPPALAWSDLGRVVARGGRDWLISELSAGRLHPCARGLGIRRVENPDAAASGYAKKCVYHGPSGCTISPDRRSATCNYYLCDEAFAEAGEEKGDADVLAARAVHDRLTALYAEQDEALAAWVRARFPEGPPWDAAFLDALGREHAALVARSAPAWHRLARG